MGTDVSKNLVSLAVATYPSLTELSYIKGVTSAIQTQLNAKAPLDSPTFTTPNIGAATGTSVNLTGTITSADFPAIGNDPDVATAGYIGRDANNNSLRGYDGTNQFIYGQKIKQIDITITKPHDLTSSLLPIWKNKTPFSFIITAIHSDSDTDNVDFTLKEAAPTNYTSLSTIEAITIATDGTSVYYNDLTSGIDDTSIAAGNVICYVKDATDDPSYVHITIVGYFDANVP